MTSVAHLENIGVAAVAFAGAGLLLLAILLGVACRRGRDGAVTPAAAINADTPHEAEFTAGSGPARAG